MPCDRSVMSDECPPGALPCGSIGRVIVRMAAAGAVVQDPDDLSVLRLTTDLDTDALRKALSTTATGELAADDVAMLDAAVLRSLAVISMTPAAAAAWSKRWAEMLEDARRSGRLSPDGRLVRVPVHRPR